MEENLNKLNKKVISPKDAILKIKNGQTVLIGSGAGEPVLLTDTLVALAEKFWDIKIIHLLTQREPELAKNDLAHRFHYSTFYFGKDMDNAMAKGAVDYTPIELGELSNAINNGFVQIDTVLLMVSPPKLDPVSLTIGRHIADIIKDGVTLHFDTGPISLSTMRYLNSKKTWYSYNRFNNRNNEINKIKYN